MKGLKIVIAKLYRISAIVELFCFRNQRMEILFCLLELSQHYN